MDSFRTVYFDRGRELLPAVLETQFGFEVEFGPLHWSQFVLLHVDGCDVFHESKILDPPGKVKGSSSQTVHRACARGSTSVSMYRTKGRISAPKVLNR